MHPSPAHPGSAPTPPWPPSFTHLYWSSKAPLLALFFSKVDTHALFSSMRRCRSAFLISRVCAREGVVNLTGSVPYCYVFLVAHIMVMAFGKAVAHLVTPFGDKKSAKIRSFSKALMPIW
jgi:hypothetical protein